MRVPERLRDRRRGPNRHRSLDRLLQPEASALGAGREDARRGLCYRNPAAESGGLKTSRTHLSKAANLSQRPVPALCNRSCPQSRPALHNATYVHARDPKPSAPRELAPQARTCSLSCLSWLPLKSWSLRQTRGGSRCNVSTTKYEKYLKYLPKELPYLIKESPRLGIKRS